MRAARASRLLSLLRKKAVRIVPLTITHPQIKFDAPVTVTSLSLAPLARQHAQHGQQHAPVVKAWARDLGALAACRFAQLLPGGNSLAARAGGGAAHAAAAEVRFQPLLFQGPLALQQPVFTPFSLAKGAR